MAVRTTDVLCTTRRFPSVSIHLDEHQNHAKLGVNPLVTGVRARSHRGGFQRLPVAHLDEHRTHAKLSVNPLDTGVRACSHRGGGFSAYQCNDNRPERRSGQPHTRMTSSKLLHQAVCISSDC
ncbi:hypothetical protein Anapl_16468 [Anas platyrhynchos]|uniref:Uncharacterized protein n=1 Tax=Anas platyrhynchos TaxID=8839 RepID=R0L0A8_ANAPL|nr:hypothetical protein Anapl_16468 [Anas platyrhynchos]